MHTQRSSSEKQSKTDGQKRPVPVFYGIAILLMAVAIGTVLFVRAYRPSGVTAPAQVTFEQKMAYLESGAPLPNQSTKPEIPCWMMGLIAGFVIIQILPLLVAAHKVRAKRLTKRDLRQIEYLTETPLFLGLLGSLLGVCLTQFMTGSLAAPLAYLTTISGILLYLLGRFTISVSVPSAQDLMI